VTPAFVGSLLSMAVNCWVAFTGMSALVGVTETVIALTITCAKFDAPVLNTEVAVMVTARSSAGGVLGAVYVVATPFSVAAGEIVPHGPGSHDRFKVTPLFVGSLATLATNWDVPPACTSPVLCESIETEVPGTRKLTPLAAVVSATEVAVTTTLKSPVGSVAGAV
jgi:hypothetical protein